MYPKYWEHSSLPFGFRYLMSGTQMDDTERNQIDQDCEKVIKTCQDTIKHFKQEGILQINIRSFRFSFNISLPVLRCQYGTAGSVKFWYLSWLNIFHMLAFSVSEKVDVWKWHYEEFTKYEKWMVKEAFKYSTNWRPTVKVDSSIIDRQLKISR